MTPPPPPLIDFVLAQELSPKLRPSTPDEREDDVEKRNFSGFGLMDDTEKTK